jgi:hypothetical protein
VAWVHVGLKNSQVGCCTSLGSSVRAIGICICVSLTKYGLVPALYEGIKASQQLVIRLVAVVCLHTAYGNIFAEVPIYLL